MSRAVLRYRPAVTEKTSARELLKDKRLQELRLLQSLKLKGLSQDQTQRSQKRRPLLLPANFHDCNSKRLRSICLISDSDNGFNNYDDDCEKL